MLIITQNGEAKAALMDIHEYEEMMESPAMLKMIAQSKKSIQDKGRIPFRESFGHIRNEINRRNTSSGRDCSKRSSA